MTTNYMKKLRLALGTARLLGAPKEGGARSSSEAKAIGRSRLCLMDDEDSLAAQNLAVEIDELAHATAAQTGATRLRLGWQSVARHFDDDNIVDVAALLAGFFDRHAGDPVRGAEWVDHHEIGIGEAGVATVTMPADWTWTGRQFVTVDA